MADHLVIVLPGIGGSVLARPGNPDDVVWAMRKRDIAQFGWQPKALDLNTSPALEPIGLVESTRLIGCTIVPGYERLLTALAGLGRVDRGDPRDSVPDADIVAVPYDFRQSVLTAAERVDAVVVQRLGHLSKADRAGRVIVIAHSLGGLVARAWAGLTPTPAGEERWRWCRAIITVGTPHRGAPKALDQLVNGVRLTGQRLDRPTRMLQGWPSMYELLPRYPAVRDSRIEQGKPGEALYPHEVPIDWLTTPAKTAYDLHLEIEQVWDAVPLKGPETVACIGWSHPTPDAAFWDGATLEVRKEMPDWLDLEGREADVGDGTVPAISALPTQFDYHAWSPMRLRERHVPMAASDTVVDLVATYLAKRPPRKVHGPGEQERPPTIGLDVDELVQQGRPVDIRVALRELPEVALAGIAAMRVTTRLEPADAADLADGTDRRVALMEWDAATGGFRAELPAVSPGLYRVEAICRDIPGVGDLHCEDAVAVVAGG